MKRPVQLGIASLKALATIVACGAAAHAALPYLPQIGPPPLRMLAVKRPAASLVKLALTPASTATNPPVAAAAPVPAVASNSMASTPPGFLGPMAGTPEERPLQATPNASVFDLPTPDLLGISPQALAAYFRPMAPGTNSVAPFGLLPVSFIPPVPPDKSSRAEYLIK